MQALVLLNDPAYLEAARGLAERVLNEPGLDVPGRLTHAFRLCTGRPPEACELRILRRVYGQQRETYRRDRTAARELAGADGSELAAWTALGNLLLNLDETITRE